MRIALGLKAHSGWAALIALGVERDQLHLVDRRRIELVEDDGPWARQPYHAAEGRSPAEARALVKRAIEAAQRNAIRELGAAQARARDAGHELVACSVLTGEPMPAWSVDEILAVHFRMHKAEGALYRDVLAHAADACAVPLVAVPEKSLAEHASTVLGASATGRSTQIAGLGKSVGPPWGKDQKDAALAALIGLQRPARGR